MIIKVAVSGEGDQEANVPSLFLNTENAVAGDYLAFIGNVISLVMNDNVDLEREANACGRTLDHEFIGAVGSIEHREDDV